MKRNNRNILQIIGLAIAFGLGGSAAYGQYDLSWYTIDGGGATFSTGGTFSLGGTIGQPDAGVMSGGSFTLTGGFWAGATGGNPCNLLGDIDSDNDVDIQDLAFLLSSFGAQTGDPNFNPAADIDGNGVVTLQDLAFLLSEFGTICP